MCSSSSTVLTRNTKISSTRLYRFSARYRISRNCSKSQIVRCCSPRPAGLQGSCSVFNSSRSPENSLPPVGQPFSTPDGALLISVFSQPSNVSSHSSQYELVIVQCFLTTSHRRCTGHLHPVSFHSSACTSVLLHCTV